jgi:vacuolar protein sorting-associated protein VTA1
MAPPVLPPIPASLKQIQHYLKTANEHDTRDPIIAYWCRVFSLSQGMKLDKSSKEALGVLLPLMDWLEAEKKEKNDEEAITNEVVANAHIENHAMKLFLWADREDRASNFNKNVVKAFYSAGMLFDVLATFGEISPEVEHHRKYAKWKAAYIHNCLKNGETPIPGPLPTEDDEEENTNEDDTSASGWTQPPAGPPEPQQPVYEPPPPTHQPSYQPQQPTYQPQQPVYQPPQPSFQPQPTGGSVSLTPDLTKKAQKYCKFAISSLDYDDTATAILNLQKALHLCQTGQDSP